MKWNLREIRREPIGVKLVFATRSCCGPDGVGPCISKAEGLPCGMAAMPDFAPPPDDVRERAEGLRRLRLDLGLSLRAAAAALGIGVVDLSGLERGVSEVDDWAALRATLEASR